jgi:hypothetical protein
MGKTTAQSDDRPGFIANRLLCPYLNEAINALQDVRVLLLKRGPRGTEQTLTDST